MTTFLRDASRQEDSNLDDGEPRIVDRSEIADLFASLNINLVSVSET
jgi:hypothetical protein